MAVAIAQTANPAAVNGDGSNNTTYTAVAIGAASSERVIVVVITKEQSGLVPTAVTINSGGGAVAMTLIGQVFGIVGAYMAHLVVPTGTTADIVVSWGAAVTSVQHHISVYSVTGADYPPSYTGDNTSTDMDVTAPLTTGSTIIAAGGGMLAVAGCAVNTVAKTWANLTEDLDVDGGNLRHTTAFSTTAGTATRTCTGTTNAEDGVMVWAHFNSYVSRVPFLVMAPPRPPLRLN